MAASNPESAGGGFPLLGRGFQLLAEGLGPFVDERMSAVDGEDWLTALEAEDRARFGHARRLTMTDPALQLRVLVFRWQVFDAVLPRSARSYAGELRETRNRWAHNEPFAVSEVRRALETMELLLRAAGAHAAADEVMGLYASTGDRSWAATEESVRETAAGPGNGASPLSAAVLDEQAQDAEDGGRPTPTETEDAPVREHAETEAETVGPVIDEDDVLVPISGILDIFENYAFVRTSGYLAAPHDVYVSLSQVRKHRLRKGDVVAGAVRQPREGERRERFNALVQLDTVNGMDPDQARNRVEFARLTPLYPQERLRLETEPGLVATRIVDLICPIGKGQRGLILAPPKAGRTTLLRTIADAIGHNNPECHVMVILVDEPPEAVTDLQRSIRGEVISSTSDRPAADHIAVVELALERAKRLVELGHDIVVLLDSITRLTTAYNLAAPASGRVLPGGLDPIALHPPKALFSAARNIEDGGSLTIMATALVETGSRMDETIAEELGRLAGMRLRLDRDLAHHRIFPALDVNASGTQQEQILLAPEEHAIVSRLHEMLRRMDRRQAIEALLAKLTETKSNAEFLLQLSRSGG
ncbi:hypothetical protein GCM10023195_88020 [Actinoallomurus liliacearum]|uniref:Transcription termination factor Rho n=1 Tax=Actinoallomurus liliacearum TaxID=1080073 RepID=A0ABP8U3B3_9ACTN